MASRRIWPVRHELQREIQVGLDRRTDDERHREVIAVQIAHELGRADQVIDPQADVDRTPQPEQACGLTVEPEDLVLVAQDDDAVGKRCRGTPQLAEELHEALLVKLLAPVQAHHLSDDVAPDPADGGRVELRAQPEPAVQAIEIMQLPAEVQTGGEQDPEPQGRDEEAETQTCQQDARETRERKRPHRRHGPESRLRL
jgi:hypothetical protein